MTQSNSSVESNLDEYGQNNLPHAAAFAQLQIPSCKSSIDKACRHRARENPASILLEKSYSFKFKLLTSITCTCWPPFEASSYTVNSSKPGCLYTPRCTALSGSA